MLAAGIALSMTACGNKDYGYHEKGVANTDTSQTQFAIMGAQSALSPGYDDNVVLNQLQEDAGISIEWTTMSESLAEQVNIRIAGDELPDAFMGVGFSNYDISRYGDDGTFIDLTPYLTEEYMPNLSKILEENPDIRSAITMDDGYIYGLPAGERMGTAGIGAAEDFYAGFGFTNWPNDVCNDLVLRSDGTVEFMCVTDQYRQALTYFHDWYAEGLMDIEMFSQSQTQLISKCSQGYVGVATWWEIDELTGEHAGDYVFLPVLDGPDGTHNVTLRTGGATNSGNLSITKACKSPANLLKFYDQWYDGEIVMQLQYGPIGVYFTDKDDNGLWNSIEDAQAREKFGKSAGELKGQYEVYGPKLILSEYYSTTFKMEARAIKRLQDLSDYWMGFVDSTAVYPMDCVFTEEELDVIDQYKPDFESTVAENEGLWIKNGGPSDDEWESYLSTLKRSCGMEELLKVYQDAYNRYIEAR